MENKTEFEVGEVFQFGLIKLKCNANPRKSICDMCYFVDLSYCDAGAIGHCQGWSRKDKTDVIFEKVEE